MIVYLDNKPLSLPSQPQAATVARAIDTAKAKLNGTGSIVVGVRCNQQGVSADRLEGVLAQPTTDFERVDLISGRPSEVALAALREVLASFGETYAGVQGAADALASGKLAEAMNLLGQCASIWSQSHQSVVESIALLGLNPATLGIAGQSVVQSLGEVRTRLGELKQAIETRDNVSLQDMLRYEMDETLQGVGAAG